MTNTLITAYVGQGLAAARPATPTIDAGAIGFYYATDTAALSVYANGAWRGVGSLNPGTPPTIVQSAFVDNGVSAAVTMGVAPTNGNLLVALCSGQNNTPSAGWTAVVTSSGGSQFGGIFTKTAGAGESTTQTPVTGAGATACVIYEIHGASATPVVYAATSNAAASLFAATAQAPSLQNVLALAAITGDGALATFTGLKNVTQDVANTGTRGIRAGHSDGSLAIAQALAQLSSAVATRNHIILLTA